MWTSYKLYIPSDDLDLNSDYPDNISFFQYDNLETHFNNNPTVG